MAMRPQESDIQKVYAIVRVDLFQTDDVPWDVRVRVKNIQRSAESAEEEVRRLNQINADKDCVYFWQETRLLPGDLPPER